MGNDTQAFGHIYIVNLNIYSTQQPSCIKCDEDHLTRN